MVGPAGEWSGVQKLSALQLLLSHNLTFPNIFDSTFNIVSCELGSGQWEINIFHNFTDIQYLCAVHTILIQYSGLHNTYDQTYDQMLWRF